MHRFKKMKLVSILTVLVMAFGLIPFATPQAASASSPSFSSLQSLSSVYYWLGRDTTGLSQVTGDLSALQSFTPSTSLESSLFGPTGLLPLPSAVINKFPGASSAVKQSNAEAAATQFLVDLAKERYSPDTTTVLTNALAFYNNDATTEENLLPGVSVTDFITFCTNAQTTGLKSALSSNYQTIMTGPASSDIASTLTNAMASAADPAITTAVSNNNWSFSSIASAEMLIDQQVDSGYLGDIALFKAYIRSMTTASTYVITPVSAEESFTLTVGTPVQFTISVLGSDATSALTPQVSNPAVTFTKAAGQFTVTGVSQTSSPVEITAYLSNPGSDWVYKANLTAVTGDTTPTVTVSQATNNQAITANTPTTTITVPSGVTGATINVASLIPAPTPTSINNPIATAPIQNAVTIDSSVYSVSATAPVQVVLAAGTIISAPAGSNWNGVINLPAVVTPTASELPANINAGSVVAISIGSDNGTVLTFSKPVSILLPGQTGKSVGYFENGGSFTPITNKLASNALTSGVDGYYDDGANITIWTTHFTTFVTYTSAATTSPGVTSGGPTGGNGGGGLAPTTTPTPTPVPAPTPVKGAIFTDVPASFWAYTDIANLSGLGYVSGYPDGTFLPNNPITRAEFCAVMDKVLNLTTFTQQTPAFSDVNTGDWYYQAVETAVYGGIASGYSDSTFQPNAPISRQQAAAILVNALGKQNEAKADMGEKTNFTDDISISSWARGFVVLAVQDALIKGYSDGSFEPSNIATRAEACAMISNFLTVYSPAK